MVIMLNNMYVEIHFFNLLQVVTSSCYASRSLVLSFCRLNIMVSSDLTLGSVMSIHEHKRELL